MDRNLYPARWKTEEVDVMCDLYTSVRNMLDSRNREVVDLRRALRAEQDARADAETVVNHLRAELEHAKALRSIKELVSVKA